MPPNADYIISVSGFGKHNIKLIQELDKRGIYAVLAPRNGSILKEYRSHLDNKHILSNHLSHSPKSSFNKLIQKYNIRSPRSFVFPEIVYDRNYPNRIYNRYTSPNSGKVDYSKYLSRLHSLLDYFDQIYSNGFSAIHITSQGAKIFRQVIHIVAKHHSVQSIRYSFNPLPGRKSVRNTMGMKFPEMRRSMEEKVTDSEQNKIEKYITSVKENEPIYAPQSGDRIGKVEKFINFIRKGKYYEGNLEKAILAKTLRPILKSTGGAIQSRMYYDDADLDDIISSSNYVYYSIQHPLESRLTLRASEYFDQRYLVEYLTRNLPSNIDHLVVKDHPHHIGQLSIQSAKDISEKAIFANPKISSHKLIKNSSAVITLNNTVGHEALVWQKPVVVLGDALYSGIGITYDVENIQDISSTINKSVMQGGPTKEEMIKYINGLYKISDEINWANTQDSVEKSIASITKRTHKN